MHPGLKAADKGTFSQLASLEASVNGWLALSGRSIMPGIMKEIASPENILCWEGASLLHHLAVIISKPLLL